MFFFDFKPYIAIIGDIINSKTIEDRGSVQAKLNAVLNEVNSTYNDDIASKFMITLGDEFQGLLQDGKYTIDIIDKIKRVMYPTKIRFGIGVGAITTPINYEMPLGADGPAYYNARKMIDELKISEKKKMESKVNIKIKIEKNEEIAELINTVFSLITVIESKWTDRQREIISVYLKCEGTQSDAAFELGINQSNVQKALSASNYYTYKKSIDIITKILSTIKEKQDV